MNNEIMKDTYTIKKAYPWCKLGFEIEISSNNLLYAELCGTHSGCQTNNLDNQDKIHELCVKVSELIQEIDKLNQ